MAIIAHRLSRGSPAERAPASGEVILRPFAPRPPAAMGVPRIDTTPAEQVLERPKPHLLIVDNTREARNEENLDPDRFQKGTVPKHSSHYLRKLWKGTNHLLPTLIRITRPSLTEATLPGPRSDSQGNVRRSDPGQCYKEVKYEKRPTQLVSSAH
ncbi:hypothetical protein K1T71_011862 [Dendrolimus kikuchii]|uniref:Uncharacterized protein n=1 Tax=Dendrolimus kikuchii TaxID=765133 RepID=A0ACC1CMG8_9NEOP|nr:hypothetical protein K1T71_011862 [Dendrolimus kikuchii]